SRCHKERLSIGFWLRVSVPGGLFCSCLWRSARSLFRLLRRSSTVMPYSFCYSHHFWPDASNTSQHGKFSARCWLWPAFFSSRSGGVNESVFFDDLLGQVVLITDLVDLMELCLDPIHMRLFIDDDMLQ